MILEKYAQFLAEIKQNTNIKYSEDEGHISEELNLTPVAFFKEDQEEILEEAEIQMSDNDLVYFQFEGVSILWESTLKNIDDVLVGGFVFNGILDALTIPGTFWKGAFSLPPDLEVPENLKKFEQLGWIEFQGRHDGTRGCFLKQSGTFPPPIVLYSRGWYTEMNMNYDEYLTKMFEMYAVKGWQFFFIDLTDDIPYIEDIIKNMKVATDVLPRLFPEKDWSDQISKYQEAIKLSTKI